MAIEFILAIGMHHKAVGLCSQSANVIGVAL